MTTKRNPKLLGDDDELVSGSPINMSGETGLVSRKRQTAAQKAAATRAANRLGDEATQARRALLYRFQQIGSGSSVTVIASQCKAAGINLSAEDRATLTAYNRLAARITKEAAL